MSDTETNRSEIKRSKIIIRRTVASTKRILVIRRKAKLTIGK